MATPGRRVRGRSFFQGIQSQLVLLIILMSFPTLLIQIYVFLDSYKAYRSEQLQANLEIARATGERFKGFVEDVLRQELAIGTAFTLPQPLSVEQMNDILAQNCKEYQVIRNLVWATPQGRSIASDLPGGIGLDISRRPYYQEILSGRDHVLSDLYISQVDGKPCFSISRGIRDNSGTLQGILVAIINPEKLDSTMAVERARGGGLALVDSKGMLVYRYPRIDVTWDERDWLRQYPQFEEVLKNGREVTATVYAGYEGKNRLVGFTPVPSLGWAATAGRTEEIAMADFTTSLLPQTVAFLLVTALTFAVALVLSRRISTPVARLRNQALSLARGESVNPVVASGPKELRELAESFETMARELKSREMSLRDQHEWLRVTLTSIGDALIACDAAGRIDFINPVAAELTGWPQSEAEGKMIRDVFRIVNEQTGEPAEDIVGRVLREGKAALLANHTALIGPDGGRIPIEDSAAPIRDEAGNVLGVVLVFHDVTAKRKAQQELSEVNRRLSTIVDSIADGFYALDADLRFTHINNAALRTYKKTREEVIGKRILDVFPSFKGSIFETAFRRAMDSGEPEHLQGPSAITDRIMEIHAYPGQSSVTVLFRDITERSRLEEELRELSQRLSYHVDHSPLAVIEWGPDMRLIRWSGEAERIFGWRAEEVLGKRMEEFRWIYHEDEAQIAEVSSHLKSGADPKRFSANRNYRKDGTVINCEWYNSSLLDDSGKLRSILSLVLDVTQRTRLEEELRKAHDELELRVKDRTAELVRASEDLRKQAALLNLAHDAILVRGVDNTVTFWNDGARELYGFTREEAMGHITHDLLHTQFPEPLERIAEQVLKMGRWDGELTQATRTGRKIIVESRWALQSGPDGIPTGFLEINRDVTTRKSAEEALRANVARLATVNAELQEFAHVASHDLQEPLRKIQTFCDMAKARCAPAMDSVGQGYLERVLTSAGRMRQLLDDLLQFSRVASKPEPFKRIDLARIVREAAEVFEKKIQEEGGLVEIESLPEIEADEPQMLRLFQNLIGNALKYCDVQSPRVRIFSRRDGQGYCEIFVQDNGIGFEQRFAERIFKPFQRLHNRKEYEGTGMGLAICRKIAERHGGDIRAESQPGKGSTFIIRLPLRQEAWEGV